MVVQGLDVGCLATLTATVGEVNSAPSDCQDVLMLNAVNFELMAGIQNGKPAFSRSSLDDRISAAEARHRNARRAAESAMATSSQPITCSTHAQDVIEGRVKVGDPHSHRPLATGFGPVSLMGRGKIPGTFRERVAAQVFQPSHSLPSMSIEQAGERELEIMAALEDRKQEAMLEAARQTAVSGRYQRDNDGPGEDEENEEETAAAEYKARAWDDWKDEHPRGQGNSKLTPCG